MQLATSMNNNQDDDDDDENDKESWDDMKSVVWMELSERRCPDAPLLDAPLLDAPLLFRSATP